MNKRILLGIFLTCLPLPMFVSSQRILSSFRPSTAEDEIMLFALLFGVPALFLIWGYRYAQQKKGLITAERFIRGGAIIGAALAALILIPMAVPVMYFRPTEMSLIHSALHIVLVMMMTILIGTGYAALFWIVTLQHGQNSKETEIA